MEVNFTRSREIGEEWEEEEEKKKSVSAKDLKDIENQALAILSAVCAPGSFLFEL